MKNECCKNIIIKKSSNRNEQFSSLLQHSLVSENKEMQEKMKETDSFLLLLVALLENICQRWNFTNISMNYSTLHPQLYIQLWHEKLQFYCLEQAAENIRIICKVSLFFMHLVWYLILLVGIHLYTKHTNPTSDQFSIRPVRFLNLIFDSINNFFLLNMQICKEFPKHEHREIGFK